MNNNSNHEKIKVVVRKRPINTKEIQKNDIDIIEIRNTKMLVAKELKNKVDMTKYIEEHHFTFDRSFDGESTNENVINYIINKDLFGMR
jgi:kinesin family protein 2/24